MNYRHAFHAGNFADVFKHSLLTRILVHLARKPTPFRYLDTHAGIGLYDLGSEEARRGAEWQGGIGRLDPAAMPEPVRALLQPYLDLVGPPGPSGRPGPYPGSPLVALGLARAQDKLVFCELHPQDAGALRKAVGRAPTAKVVTLDGYLALNAFLPPPERRGLVLVDPPFEERSEFEAMLRGLEAAYRKWPTGIYALWYPLKDRAAVTRFTTGLKAGGLHRVAQIELVIDAPALARGSLGGCGMILVNPPFGLAEECAEILPYLAARLARSEPGAAFWRWLVQE